MSGRNHRLRSGSASGILALLLCISLASAGLFLAGCDALDPVELDAFIGGAAAASGSTYDFGSVLLTNVEPVLVTVTLKCTGTAPLSITSIALSGSGASQFILDANGVGDIIEEQAEASFTLGFAPDALGIAECAVLVQNSDKDEGQYQLNFKGRGSKSPGSLDLSFGQNGMAIAKLESSPGVPITAHPAASAVQADGKIVTVGICWNVSHWDWAIVRQTRMGGMDIFGSTAGFAKIDFFGLSDSATCLAILSDGSILVGGSAGRTSSHTCFALAKLTPWGLLDTTFGSGGKATADIGSFMDVAMEMFVSSDGKITLVGCSSATSMGGFKPALARFTSSGQPDTTFDGDGKVVLASTDSTLLVSSAVIDANGRILISGWAGGSISFVGRIQSSGVAYDASFGDANDGIIRIPSGNTIDLSAGMYLRSDGRIVLADQPYSGRYYAGLIRLNADGNGLDKSFSTTGIVTFPGPTNASFCTAGSYVEINGKSYFGGFENSSGTRGSFLARLQDNGTLDTSFGNAGYALAGPGGYNDSDRVDILSDNSGLILLSASGKLGTVYTFALYRFEP